ncbi:MAG: ABC transporter ATP-binding protein [Kiritimatiellae bacterium]|jgi:putative ABC transport system ATP-binding protein|nr:ABC transporter ATP-binding protein [Kiritimatiellia bacterium]
MSFLSIQNISKNYVGSDGQIQVLQDFSLELDKGLIHSVVGPSGCGKSTLLMLCGGLIHPDSGSITIGGDNLLELSAGERALRRASLVGFVFQRFHLIPYLNVEQNIMASCVARPVEKAQDRCDELMKRLGLEHRRGHIPARLSAGEQQRVALGRSLMNSPSMLVADEPTGNLDEENTAGILTLLREFTDEGGMVLMATHDRSVADVADRKYVYKKGIFEQG